MPTKWLLLILLLTALSRAEAQTINAASCSSTDVQNALNSITADGTTVNIPAGNCTWTTEVTYNQVYSTTIQGQSTTAGTCAPGGTCSATDNTVITDHVAGVAFQINTASGKSFRLSGITFNPSSGTAAYGAITIGGASTLVRVDHSHFNDTVAGDHTFQVDGIQGVFDHNYFDSSNQSDVFFFQFTNAGASTYGHESWNQADNFGTSQFIFAENNYFVNGTFAFDCYTGGRHVFRYNIVGTNTRLQNHGTQPDIHRGCRLEEVYNNTFTFSSNPASSSFSFLMDQEGGTGMWWGNTVTGFCTFQREDVVRTNGETYAEGNGPPAGWGYCGTTIVAGDTTKTCSGGLCPSAWDENTSNTMGNACMDQVGRGQGDLLSGDFPTVCNQTQGCSTYDGQWPRQAQSPMYNWGNTVNTSSYCSGTYWGNFDYAAVENRDYYLQLPNLNESSSFNGSAGIGTGSTAPTSTCTPYVGYWDTTNSTLYQCSSTNTWTAYYTPYTYPHPLTQGNPNPPSPPTGLTAIIH